MKARLKAAQNIVKNPIDYKVCYGCGSILVREVDICPNCHAYRYNFNTVDIIARAKFLGTREQKSVTSEDLK